MKKFKKTKINGKIFHAHGFKESILLKVHTTLSDLQIQCNLYPNSNSILHRNRKKQIKTHRKPLKKKTNPT